VEIIEMDGGGEEGMLGTTKCRTVVADSRTSKNRREMQGVNQEGITGESPSEFYVTEDKGGGYDRSHFAMGLTGFLMGVNEASIARGDRSLLRAQRGGGRDM
jgi:hypothetical protein